MAQASRIRNAVTNFAGPEGSWGVGTSPDLEAYLWKAILWKFLPEKQERDLRLFLPFQGGTIGLSSTPSEGNVLWFELPLQPLDASEATSYPLLEENSIMRSSRISSGSRSKGGSRSRVHIDIATLVKEVDGSMRWEGYSPRQAASDRKGEDVI